MNAVKFIDRPCGTGKTTRMINSFCPTEQYLVVVPTLSEVQRVLRDSRVPFTEPDEKIYGTKMAHLERLLAEGENIVTTHKLFDAVDIRSVDLSAYNLFIDEVFDVIENVHGPSNEAWDAVYIRDRYATVDSAGQVTPTDKWRDQPKKLDPTLRFDLFCKADAGRLHKTDNGYFVDVVTPDLFTKPKQTVVHTYLAEVSLMAAYLNRHGIPYVIDRDHSLDMKQRAKAQHLLSIHQISALENISMSHTKQGLMRGRQAATVSAALKNLRSRSLRGVEAKDIMITCRKDKWLDHNDSRKGAFAYQSKLTAACWIAKTTKGTNEYRNCTHAVYLSKLNLSPNIIDYLGIDKQFEKDWAVSELIQWLYRTGLRDGQKVELYLASSHMKCLLEEWLYEQETVLELVA